MTEIYFIRHGESELNLQANDIVGGRSNHTPLTHAGAKQAWRAGSWLFDHRIIPNQVITSPAIRTRQTATELLSRNGMNTSRRVVIDDRLQELSQGIMEGQARHEVWRPDTVQELLDDPYDFKFEDGESLVDVQQRMIEAIDEYADNAPDSRILIVSHGIAIRALVGLIKHASHHEIMRVFTTPNASLTTVYGNPHDWHVGEIGRDIANEEKLRKH